MTDITDRDKLLCAEREVRMRERVYPRWVGAGKMKLDAAEREIAVMKAIAEDYRAAVATETSATELPF